MDGNDATERLEALRNDLVAYTEAQIPILERLAAEVEESIQDLRNLLDRNKRNDESRRKLDPPGEKPQKITVGDVEYGINDEFRAAALAVADEIDLDELQAAERCFDAAALFEGQSGNAISYRAIVRFHDERYAKLDCLRLLMALCDSMEAGDEMGHMFKDMLNKITQGDRGGPSEASAFFRKCVDGLAEVESYLSKNTAHKQTMMITGQPLNGEMAQYLATQQVLLSEQHECLCAILAQLMSSGHASPEDFRPLLSRASQREELDDTSIHYLPIFVSGAARFGAEATTPLDAAKELHGLLAPGPTRLQWKQPMLRAAATVCWLAEYNSRFVDPMNAPQIRVADRQREEEERQKLFFECVKDRAFHFLLLACQHLKPEIWYDPAKVGLVRYLMEDTPVLEPSFVSPGFASLVMTGLQGFGEAFVANMPDVLRRLKADEDGLRRAHFSKPTDVPEHDQLDLERFLVILSYAYQDNPDAAQDFWADKESNMYGFLRWTSRRLPTPRVAAFCELLRSIAGDESSANHAHLFLKEDAVMTGGRLRKSYSVSWSQIFSELDIYASTVKNKPANAMQVPNSNSAIPEGSYDEPETYIMLESYLRLASHLCRTSPDARNWILREQSFHIGEMLFQLASTGNDSKVHAVCFNMLAALLTDKIPEVNEGMWALLDTWISGGGSSIPRHGRQSHPEQRYLNNYVANPETAAGIVNFLNALLLPTQVPGEVPIGALPFPESLGMQSRHGGVEVYVDFVLGPVIRSTISDEALRDGRDRVPIDVLRYACLNFICICLSSFNEDLVGLANATSLNVDAAIRTTSLAAYIRLHPFARVMDWLLSNNVIHAFAHVLRQDIETLNQLKPDSPRVQATLKAVQTMDLAMKLQATYFDIVRPMNAKDMSSRSQSNANASLSSYDEVILSQLELVTDIVSFAASTNTDLSLASLSLLQKLCRSRKLNDQPHYGDASNARLGSRLIGHLAEASDSIAIHLQSFFAVTPLDLDSPNQPPKLAQANAILDMLNGSLDNADGRPAVAHCLLGFACRVRSVAVEPDGTFSQGVSLFHNIAACAVQAPAAIEANNVSWLLKLKEGCMNLILKLALSPMTASIVLPSLRAMEFLPAAAERQLPASPASLWDQKTIADPALLLDSSSVAVQEMFGIREAFFEYAALELRKVTELKAYSVQEKAIAALLGRIILPDGQQAPILSVYDLFDFFDLQTEPPLVASCHFLDQVDLTPCMEADAESGGMKFDVEMAEQLLQLRKRELELNGTIKEALEEAQVDDEIRATCASLTSQNHWQAIQSARLSALEAWADLLSSLVTSSGLQAAESMNVALQGLQIVLPRLERTLISDMDSAILLAKLTLTLVQAATAAPAKDQAARSTGLVHERLMSSFRTCLKVITDSSTGLGLRDICYRICCAVLSALPLTVSNGKISPSTNARQLLQLLQGSGERLIIVNTEDAFSGRGITRVSSLLFLDALIALFQLNSVSSSMLKALEKLNFIPVLIDHSIGCVTSSFSGDNDELVTAVAYFHTALSLLLRVCQTAEGTHLTLNSGFFAAVAESKLFSTDPDIGLDIDNPVALREFYRLLSAVLRVVTAVVLNRGAGNANVLQQAKNFLQENRFSMQAVFKRTSAVQKTAGPPEKEALDVADEFARLLIVTGFLEDDEPAHARASRMNGFT